MIGLTDSLPCYQEEQNIEQTHASRLAKEIPELEVVTQESNLGHGTAVRSGLDMGKKEWIAYMDRDGQFGVSDLDKLIPYSREDDVITGANPKVIPRALREMVVLRWAQWL